DVILQAVRKNLPGQVVPLPEIAGNDHKMAVGRVIDEFRKQLLAMGGRWYDVVDAAAARLKVMELFPAAKVICSAVPEVPGTRRVEDVRDSHELNDVDVGVIRSPLGVAEAGAVWLTQDQLVVNALGVLAQHLVVLLDPAAVVADMHDAYQRINL